MLEYNLHQYQRKRLINQDHTKDQQIILQHRILINSGVGATSYFNDLIKEYHLMINLGIVLLLKLWLNILLAKLDVILCLMGFVVWVGMR